MNVRYKYYRDNNNRPLVTLCTIEHNNKKVHGVAICSPLDNPCKATGKTIAFNRAYHALLHPTPDLPVTRKEAKLVLAKCLDLGTLVYTINVYKAMDGVKWNAFVI